MDRQKKERQTDRHGKTSIPQHTSKNSIYMYLNVSVVYINMRLNNIYIYRESCPTHSVETPSVVDPQWYILYWGSKSAEVGLLVYWGQHLLTMGLLMFAFSWVDFLSLLWSPSIDIEIFYFRQICHLKYNTKSSQNSCWFKMWMCLVGQIFIKLIKLINFFHLRFSLVACVMSFWE